VQASVAIPVSGDHATPWDYVPELNKIVLYTPADAGAMYEIDVPGGNLAQPWPTVRRSLPAGAPQMPGVYVVGKRFSWSSALRSIVYKPLANAPAAHQFFVYRPVGI
jgi:hypothetical protein